MPHLDGHMSACYLPVMLHLPSSLLSLDYPIKKSCLDNVGEFISKAFDDYCMSVGIEVEHPIAHVHIQIGLAEAFIKRLQLIARPLLMSTKLPIYA